MTEEEWWTTRDYYPLLESLLDRASDRKLRLFACGCCRRIEHMIDSRLRDAVEVAERHSDGLATDADLEIVYRRSDNNNRYEGERVAFYLQMAALQLSSHPGLMFIRGKRDAALHAAKTVPVSTKDAVSSRAAKKGGESAGQLASDAERGAQAILLRDIIANPFHPLPTIDPAWQKWKDATIVKLAQQMYDSRDFVSMPMLADALEEAGCTDADILDHCRSSGVHVRGCWVVDLILGKD